MNKAIFLTVSLLIITLTIYAQVKPDINIVAGTDPAFCQKLSKTLSRILLESNRVFKGAGNLESVRDYFTDEGFNNFKDIVEKTKPYTAKKRYNLNVIEVVTSGLFEVRGIKVHVDVGETEASPVQYLVFSFNKKGKIARVRYSIPAHNYQDILNEGIGDIDKARRQKILEFLEVFGTAYSRKDADFLEKIFSDDALIISGTVLYKKPEFNDLMTCANKPPEKIVQYRQYTKKQYIERLRKYIFPSNSYINLKFEDIKIIRHRKMDKVYGIKLKQHWKAEKYEDVGYLFLTVYFWKEDNPVILVRVWQDTAFQGDYDVSIYDFDIID
ncbi:MAG: hypothetical protein H0Z29_09450 [Candidatus Marinimicrobia bacterium]|nr:hypothetical protein [Candidatus Neomarinimicrobiota bacterium]